MTRALERDEQKGRPRTPLREQELDGDKALARDLDWVILLRSEIDADSGEVHAALHAAAFARFERAETPLDVRRGTRGLRRQRADEVNVIVNCAGVLRDSAPDSTAACRLGSWHEGLADRGIGADRVGGARWARARLPLARGGREAPPLGTRRGA
jgi:hypothetical protein